MNPDHAKPLESKVEAIAENGKVLSNSLAAVTRQQQQFTRLELSQAAQNAKNYRQAVFDASLELEQLLKVPANEFDLAQFFQTADVFLKSGKSSYPGNDQQPRITRLQNEGSELVDTPYRQQFSFSEPPQELDSLAKSQVKEIAEQVQSDRNVVAQYVDNAKNQSPELINEKLKETEITNKPYLDAATSNIMSAQGKIFSESVKTMLDFQGDKHPDGSRTFDSDNYHFRLDGPSGSVSVTASNGGTILAQGKVMQSASNQDIKALETINDLAQELVQSKHLAQTQSKVQNQVLSL